MKMEDHFKETLRRAVANEPPVVDSWDRFEHRLGRSRRWRMIASIAGAAAVIAAAAVVVPQLGTDRKIRVENPGTPTPTPTPTQTVDPYAGWQTFENPDQHYRFKYPSNWRLSMFEAVYEVNPDGLPSTDAKGADGSLGLIVNVLESSFFPEPLAAEPGAVGDDRASDAAETRDGTILYLRNRFDWSASRCITLGTTCPEGDDLILIATINGEDTPALMGRYREVAELIVASLEYVP